jgi:hypothetical protein
LHKTSSSKDRRHKGVDVAPQFVQTGSAISGTVCDLVDTAFSDEEEGVCEGGVAGVDDAGIVL